MNHNKNVPQYVQNRRVINVQNGNKVKYSKTTLRNTPHRTGKSKADIQVELKKTN